MVINRWMDVLDVLEKGLELVRNYNKKAEKIGFNFVYLI